jgi:hypothetical protein
VFSGSRWRAALIALTLVLAVGTLARAAQERDRVRLTRVAIAQVHDAVARFRAEVGRCPRSMGELAHPPRGGSHYLRETPLDGWGRPLILRCPGLDDPDGEDVISAGPSGSLIVDDNMK